MPTSLHERLVEATRHERDLLLAAGAIHDALAGVVSLPRYLAFLGEAFQHVRHTVPLLMTAGGRLPTRLGWLQADLRHYIEEEAGHDEWILNDIRAAGGDAEAVRAARPHPATDALVARVYDEVQRRNPVGIFGMVHVLEGTSVALALNAALALAWAAWIFARKQFRPFHAFEIGLVLVTGIYGLIAVLAAPKWEDERSRKAAESRAEISTPDQLASSLATGRG